jgi:hypothetical protein
MKEAEEISLDLHNKRKRIVEAMDRLKKISLPLYNGALLRDLEANGKDEVLRLFPIKMRTPTDTLPRDGWVYDTTKE